MRYSKEQAKEVLSRYPNLPGLMRGYFEATINDTLTQFYLDDFKSMRDDYSDELPDIDVRILPTMILEENPPIQYKCQAQYVISLNLRLKGMIEDEILSNDDITTQINDFLASDLNFQVKDPRNQKRIININNILSTVIAFLGFQAGL